jgi:hypothetical protein
MLYFDISELFAFFKVFMINYYMLFVDVLDFYTTLANVNCKRRL